MATSLCSWDFDHACAMLCWCFGGRGRGWVGCAENCVVIAEGRLQHDGEMKVTALGMPPTEPREESQAAAQARCSLEKSWSVAVAHKSFECDLAQVCCIPSTMLRGHLEPSLPLGACRLSSQCPSSRQQQA